MAETIEMQGAGNRTFPRTILVVEDSPTQALHLQALLEQEGVNVVLASDGLAGLQMARRLHPDLIVLDVQMPEMNGLQVCQQLKRTRETTHIPVIMLTRHDDPQILALGLQTGVVDYISKDASADAVLLETLRQMGLMYRMLWLCSDDIQTTLPGKERD